MDRSPPPPSFHCIPREIGLLIGVVAVISLIILGVIFAVSAHRARKARRIILSDLQTIVVPQLPSGGVHVWEADSPTIERFFIELAQDNPVRFTPKQLCAFTGNYITVLGSGAFGKVYKGQFPNGVKIGRRKNTGDNGNSSNESLDWFPKKVWEEFEKGELMELTEACGITDKDRVKAERMAMVALWCAQDSPEARPPMSAVVKMLEGVVEIMPPPKPFNHLYSVGTNALELPSGSGTDYTSSEGASSYWYKKDV